MYFLSTSFAAVDLFQANRCYPNSFKSWWWGGGDDGAGKGAGDDISDCPAMSFVFVW